MAQERAALMYTQWEIAVREIGGGIWFWTSLWLSVAFLAYIIRQTSKDRNRDWNLIYAAASLLIYFLGSMIRGFITWMQFFYVANGWDASYWIQLWPWYGLSVTLNIIGAAVCIWLLSSWRWRAIFTTCAVIGALVMPVAFRVLV